MTSLVARRFRVIPGALLSIACAAIGLAPAAAHAQGLGQPGSMGQPPGGGFGGPAPGGSKKKGTPKPAGPETHAASNDEAQQSLQTAEPSLPADPTAIPPSIAKRIGTDVDEEYATGLGNKVERDFYGPYYQEKSGSYRFRTLFPLWAERTMPGDRASLFGFYYNRRSTNVDADVLFPAFWRLRDHETRTTVVGPFMHREREAGGKEPARHDNWLAPLVFEGASADGSGYFHVPPLLTFTQHSAHDGLNIVGPMFCKWKGGPNCDVRTADKIDMGLAPLYFYGKDETSEYEIIPPLLHYYHYSDIGNKSTNLWGPYLAEHSPEGDVFNIMPFFWHSTGKNESHTTLFPLFHYGYKGSERLIVTPLFLSSKGEKGESTFVTWGYARYRGRTSLDMITPFWWHYEDPDIGLDTKLLFPFFYKSDSPRHEDTVVFPFYGHFKKPGLSETTWVTPLFRHTTSSTGWETDLYPIFYSGESNGSSHTVVAPIFWDFKKPHSRSTVALPLFFRFSDDTSVSQLVANTYYKEKKVDGGKDWEFHFFPAFSFGASPTGHWWNVLYGLAGYTQEGSASRMRLLYIPIKLSE